MISIQEAKDRISRALEELTQEGLIEIVNFIEYLKFKRQRIPLEGEIVAIEGLWEDLDFDITDEEVT